MNNVHFSSQRLDWKTPKAVIQMLEAEFGQLHDASDKNNGDAFSYIWPNNTFINPPYGKQIGSWIKEAFVQSVFSNALIIALIPSRTDTKWWHDYVMKADNIRFIKGRLKFDDQKNSAPFPSCVVIWNERGVR